MKSIIALSSVLILAGCAYVIEKEIQELTIETPGAHNTVCYVYVDKLRYKFVPPQTKTISQSKDALEIDCLAPGNRRKQVSVDPVISEYVAGNIMNGVVPGVLVDALSGAAFKYPDVIRIDFTGIPVKSMPLPAQNSPDIKQPEEYKLEEFNAALPRLNSDLDVAPVLLKKRVTETPTRGASYIGEGDSGGKGHLPDVPYTNPVRQGTSQPSASENPAPLYPGQ